MAVYKLFPEKDASLYSLYPSMNTGLDQILEASTTAYGSGDANPQVSRFLIQFDNTEIADVLDNLITSASVEREWESFLRLNASTVTGMSLTSSLDILACSKTWEMGTGLYLDNPITENGTSWVYRTYSGSNQWVPTGDPFTDAYGNYTGSNNSTSAPDGGGTWYTSTNSSSIWNLSQSVDFNYRSKKDIISNVTDLVYHWVGSGSLGASIPNNGFLVKQPNSHEFIDSQDVQVEFKYFSIDTHTIYPPCLEFRWDDWSFNTGSSTQTILDSSSPYISIQNNSGKFYQDAVNRFKVNSRPEFPIRTFQTASVYTNNYYLPESASYAVKDLDTNEYVINFDQKYTRISADSNSSYFDIYMNGLEPERYYKILISCSIAGNQYILEDDSHFKIING